MIYTDSFSKRHIGPSESESKEMLKFIGVRSVDKLIQETIPANILKKSRLKLPKADTEFSYLQHIREIAQQNKVYRSFIGQGYYGTITPIAISRNIFQNPGWYTQYTPYQAEIAQGRLEAILNFQTMISDLTAMPIANASLLDEGTAAAEAMHMFYGLKNKTEETANKFFVDAACFAQTISVIRGRAEFLGIDIVVGNYANTTITADFFGALIQYPASDGSVRDYRSFVAQCHEQECYVCVAADILSLTLLTPPGEWGADCVVGNSQRFGVPMGYGGPHAAFFATRDEYKRVIPGRIIGLSIDAQNKPALRMALQTREQHIRREKATSNICTAQALLAIMAGMYAVYHGKEGVTGIARRVHQWTTVLHHELKSLGFVVTSETFFDTLTIAAADQSLIENIRSLANKKGINFFYQSSTIGISLDETVTEDDVKAVLTVLAKACGKKWTGKLKPLFKSLSSNISDAFIRKSSFLTHPVFERYHTETKLMRYIKSLERKDLSLTHSMIPLGSCTMKLNAAAELEPVSWPQFAHIHPFVPYDQAKGYHQMIKALEEYLIEITDFAACSLQPNSGAQGEYAGLLAIRTYQRDIGQGHRNIALIPASAHGTNPASAVMAGLTVVVVGTDSLGNIDYQDLEQKVLQYKDTLSCLLITYPSTHGVFESKIKDVCALIHQYGGQVYMDGANLNAQVGLTSPGYIGADVNHINLHKTFAIPHGGGGPGMGPICVAAHLAPYLPGNPLISQVGGEKKYHAISSAPWGSASILLISYGYIRMLGEEGVTDSTRIAILNANYIKARLEKSYPVLYTGAEHGRVAHELILDFRSFKQSAGVEVEDVAKRLMDYGFHAPTVSFPVAGTLMIEPTESESKDELDRFCEAMLSIREEIRQIENGIWDKSVNPLKNAPHTADVCLQSEWNNPYTREQAAYPLPWVRENKFWPSVSRVNNPHGDRNLICTCAPVESYVK